jgi:hypothetical protein
MGLLNVTHFYILRYRSFQDRLCDLVVRVLGCKPTGPGFNSRLYQILSVEMGLKRGPLNLVRINQELLE